LQLAFLSDRFALPRRSRFVEGIKRGRAVLRGGDQESPSLCLYQRQRLPRRQGDPLHERQATLPLLPATQLAEEPAR